MHGGDDRVFISSADWMPRNLDRRVELLTPVEDANAKRLLITILETYFKDTEIARQLGSDGSYKRVKSGKRKGLRSQETLFEEAVQAAKQAAQSPRTMFRTASRPWQRRMIL